MTALELLFTFAGVFAAGSGVTLLVARDRSYFGWCEFAALAWIFGTAVVSLGLWVLGMAGARGFTLQALIVVLASALLFAGWLRSTRGLPAASLPACTPVDWLLIGILALEFCAVILISYKRTLGWDGLINWEMKARYAFLNGGALPAAYFSAAGRAFTHPEYPLAIPYTELWFYLSLGEAHQFWAKCIFPIFYASGATLLASVATRLTSMRWIGLTVAALLFLTPQVVTGTGAASSGYADFPLATIYLGAIGFLALSTTSGEIPAFRIYAALLAFLPWFKREGLVLWFVAATLGIIVIWRTRTLKRLGGLLPGLLIYAAWKIFLIVMRTAPSHDFAFVREKLVSEAPHRVALITSALCTEFTSLERWSLLWPLLACACIYLVWSHRSLVISILVASTVIPIILYAATYLFSAWPDVGEHIDTSLSRLLMQVAPLAWLLIAFALARAVRPACATAASARNAESGIDGAPSRHA